MTGLATRIALLLPDLTGGGVERTAVSLAQGLLDRGIEVDLVLCRVRGPLLAELPGAVRVVPLKRSPMILGRLLMAYTDPGGIPAQGNISTNWDLSDPDHPNPEYR